MHKIKKLILNNFVPHSLIVKKRRQLMTEMYYSLKDDPEEATILGLNDSSKHSIISFMVKDLNKDGIVKLDYKTVHNYINFRTEEEKLT